MESAASAQSGTPSLPERLEVSRDEITVGERLWSEARGNICQGKWRKVMDIAVKILRPDKTSPEEYLNEAKILSQLQHHKILQFLALSTEKEPPYIITELIVKGPLLQFLRKNQGEVTDAVVAHMAAQIADGMAYLGSMNIVHRDLRAANILVGTHHSVKVAGFELAHTMTNNTYKADKDAKFPLKWTSPEAAQEYTFSVKSDVWSFGVLLYELSTYGKPPYTGMDPKQALEQVAKGYRMPQPVGRTCCNKALYDIMCKCWDADPDKRPSSASLHNRFENRYLTPVYGVLKQNCLEVEQFSEIVFIQAEFDYKAYEEDEMSFGEGDVMKVEEALDLHWWTCSHLKTAERKMVPSNYVSRISLLQAATRAMESWWVEFGRKEAEKVFLSRATLTGTFLVQESTTGRGYVISVRDTDKENGDPKIVHYNVNVKWDGGVHIDASKEFSNILQLIEHYSENADELCTRLTVPCPRKPPVVQFRELEVRIDTVKVSKVCLGHGRYGDVWKGSLWGTLDVAVKIVKADSDSKSDFEEAKILHRLRHDRILQLLAVSKDKDSVYIVTELMVNGTLLEYLHREEGAMVTFPNLVAIASQIADGLAYLETERILHLDVRADNILVGERQEIKVADFSDAVFLQDEDYYTMSEGTKIPVKWSAPEVHLDGSVSFKSMVWSFGVVLYELITRGSSPYPGMTNSQVAEHVRSGRHMDKPTGGLECPDAFYAIMCKCWELDPENRPPFSQLFDSLETYFVSTEAEPDSFVQPDSCSPQKEAEMQRRPGYDRRPGHDRRPGYERRSAQPLPLPRHLLRFYRMEAIPRGICLIVNNRDFYKDPRNTTAVMLTRRQGTDVDRDKLQSTFEKLHFKVEVHDNKTDTELLRLLVDTARQDHSMYDCFVCCILSHGSLGVVYGANGVAVAIRDLTSQLRAQLCPSLRGKPKLFFLQACQGLAEQAGYDCRDTESDAVEEEEVQKIPDEADFLLGYSTIPGFVSYRNRQTGSWYIRKLTETLDECAEDHDIHEILTMVNYSVGKDDVSTVRGTRKQTPAPMYTLRKKLIFKRSQ